MHVSQFAFYNSVSATIIRITIDKSTAINCTTSAIREADSVYYTGDVVLEKYLSKQIFLPLISSVLADLVLPLTVVFHMTDTYLIT